VSDELAERVERGAARLDERRPGWWDEVDVGRLLLEDECRCVLGQLWGWYPDGKIELGLVNHPGADFGFLGGRIPGEWGILADLWRAAIKRRRTQEPA
jgi:hypothetical protein